MQIGTLGPQYSFSHMVARKVSENIEFFKRITDVFEAVDKGQIDYGIVPIENFLQGSVRETLFDLRKYKLQILKAYRQTINHQLASQTADYQKIVSHPQALGQCAAFLKNQTVDIVETTSTSYAMQLASEDKTIAAVGSQWAAEKYGLKILHSNIEDTHENKTKFVLIAKDDPRQPDPEDVTTSLFIEPHEDRPGLLFEVLSVFEIKKINLTKIESLPSQKKFGEYLFYMEISSSFYDQAVKDAVAFLSTFVNVSFAGSYNYG